MQIDSEGPKPGDYTVGSAASRAAARSLLQARMAGKRRREVIIGIDEGLAPRAFEYGEDEKSGELARMVAIPYGMTVADGFRAIGGFTEEELAFSELQTVVDCTDLWFFVH